MLVLEIDADTSKTRGKIVKGNAQQHRHKHNRQKIAKLQIVNASLNIKYFCMENSFQMFFCVIINKIVVIMPSLTFCIIERTWTEQNIGNYRSVKSIIKLNGDARMNEVFSIAQMLMWWNQSYCFACETNDKLFWRERDSLFDDWHSSVLIYS